MAVNSDSSSDPPAPDFQAWLTDVGHKYKNFSDCERNLTLDHLIALSGASQLFHLQYHRDSLVYRDFIKLLPPELCEYLLCFLDPVSLQTACKVSRTWQNVIASSAASWQRACVSLGLVVDKQMNPSHGHYWKKYYSKMSNRVCHMKVGACFKGFTYERQLRRITAVFYFQGRLATASDAKRIQIWDCQTDQCISEIRTDSSISSIKFDHRRLIMSSYLGHLVCYDVNSCLRLVDYLRHSATVFTFDYSERLNIVVSGSADTKIKVWSLKMGNLISTLQFHSNWVLKVMLRTAYEVNDNLFCHLLFSMSKSSVCVWGVTQSQAGPDSISISLLYSISIPYSDLYTPGLHFDGTHLYFVKQDIQKNSKAAALFCKWNVLSGKMESETPLKTRVKLLLGVGKKYIVVITPEISGPNFLVIDNKTLQEVAVSFMPPSRPTTPDCSQITLGDLSWLDGLDGKNDQGVLLAAGLDDRSTYVLKWIPHIS